jgi:hypothetical protein
VLAVLAVERVIWEHVEREPVSEVKREPPEPVGAYSCRYIEQKPFVYVFPERFVPK